MYIILHNNHVNDEAKQTAISFDDYTVVFILSEDLNKISDNIIQELEIAQGDSTMTSQIA